MKELDALNVNIKELNKRVLFNDYNAFDILQIMKEIRYNALTVEDNLMAQLFPKTSPVWCSECGGAIDAGVCAKCGDDSTYESEAN